MSFKTDTSFLRFLSMGALGVRQTMKQLRALGFEPIELERYCASNKIWMTKVKRLRLPDVLCVRSGLRVEVRAKSDLKIRMSDASSNPERTWDAGLRNDDLAAFIAIVEEDAGQHAADDAVFFTIGALRNSVSQSRLGAPKSASEGAERDRTWPAIIPSRNGTVRSVRGERLVVEMGGDGRSSRSQTYSLKGKRPYVQPGDLFKADVSMLAGAPAQLADLRVSLAHIYDPELDLRALDSVDRYAAVKALRYREDLRERAPSLLKAVLASESEERVTLEAAGAGAALGSSAGREYIERILSGDGRPELRMEAVLILTELDNAFAKRELKRVATDPRFVGNEIRQAAVWGFGKAGLKAYDELLPFISDSDDNVAMHAIAAFGSDTPRTVVQHLVAELIQGDKRRQSAASESLRMISTQVVVDELVDAASRGGDWVLATLGRLPANLVRSALEGSNLLRQIAPMLLLSEGSNWLASEDRIVDLAFLAKQNL